MRSSRFRAAARVFAMLLLAWTAADVCGHGVCEHDREPIAPAVPAAPDGPASANRQPLGAPAETPAPTGPDDCFCCSRFVDVQIPFVPTIAYTMTWAVPDPIVPAPAVDPTEPYRPPV